MICPNCGKMYDGNSCPVCGGIDSPAAPSAAAAPLPDGVQDAPVAGKAPRPSHWMRNAAILVAAAAVLSVGTAVAAQRYGGNWGFLLPTGGVLSSSDNEAGAPYDEFLPSGHYVVGVDIPAGLYTITAEKGEGRLFTALGVVDENLVAQGGPDTICGFEDVSLAVGDTLTATGMTIRVRGTAAGTTSARSNTAVEPVTLAVLSGTLGSSPETNDPSGSQGAATTSSSGGPTGSATDSTGTAANSTGTSVPSTGTTAPVPPPSATFRAGEDFPAGVYTVLVLRGDGLVVSGAETAGGIYAHMAEVEENGAVREFRNVNLSDGAELVITGLDVRLVPSR